MLEIKPVIRYAKPRYPDAEQALKNPDLLKRLPARFAAKPIVCAALGAVLSLGLAGCQSFTEPDPSLTPAAGGQGCQHCRRQDSCRSSTSNSIGFHGSFLRKIDWTF